ncbi:YceG family protein [Carnobacterium gallinarum]|uniref:YceG family protein n=1 Tax=Carnobacterium gallinarum TaxID=2749 RepID=UPI0005521906|nr:YceG family protein [Carnobacterium gallinarum]
MELRPIPQNINQIDWQVEFPIPVSTRIGFEKSTDEISYPQIYGVILGVPLDEFSYNEWLYDLVYADHSKIHLLNGNLDKQIDNQVFQGIQKLFNTHQEQKGLSPNRFVAFMQGNNLLPLKNHPDHYRYLTLKFIDLITIFSENNGGLLHPDFRRVVVDCIKWGFNYIDKWLQAIDFPNEIPQVIWYGAASKSEVYFLILLYLLGFDVLVFNSEKNNIFKDLKGITIPTFEYPSEMPLEPFPTEKPTRKSTTARKASMELNKIMNSDGSLLLKPFQLREYLPESITLQTTYDEIRIIGKEKAFVRPNFKVKNELVEIPTLFSKVLGISTDRTKYWQDFYELKQSTSLVEVIRTFPIKPEIKGNQKFHYQFALENGRLNPEKIIESNWWLHKEVSKGMQLALASGISRCVEKADFLPQGKETKEDIQLYLFSQAMNIPPVITKLLQQFDYAQDIPKIMIYNDGNSGIFTRSDAALLLILNEIGFDIVIYNPTGQNDIELYIEASKFDSHWLDEVSFNETFQTSAKGTTALKSIFNKFVK